MFVTVAALVSYTYAIIRVIDIDKYIMKSS
jgi:hypothetical protein